jgi:hypothetical protein
MTIHYILDPGHSERVPTQDPGPIAKAFEDVRDAGQKSAFANAVSTYHYGNPGPRTCSLRSELHIKHLLRAFGPTVAIAHFERALRTK